MKKYKTADGIHLKIAETHSGFVIGWFVPDEDDMGLMLGDWGRAELDDEDTLVAVQAMRDAGVGSLSSSQDLGESVFVFETLKEARKALQIANAALLAHAEKRPLPEWAAKALAEGWKPPKGWGSFA